MMMEIEQRHVWDIWDVSIIVMLTNDLVELIARWDGSWKFRPDNRWGFFPSASLGWRVSEENFWKESKIGEIVTNLKLRGSYGEVGDDAVSGSICF